VAAYDSVILAESGLVSYWKLDEAAGSTATDSKDANNGTYTGSAPAINLAQPPPATLMAGAISMNASTGYVSVADATNLHLTAPLSLEIWFKTAYHSADQGTLLAHYTTPTGFAGWALAVINGKANLWVGDTGSSWLAGTRTVSDGCWHHLVGTLSGTTVTLYVDGTQDATGTRTPSLSSTSTLYLGRTPDSMWYFSGWLSAAAIYNGVALSSGTVLSHYQAAGRVLDWAASGPFPGAPRGVPGLNPHWSRGLLVALPLIDVNPSGLIVKARDWAAGKLPTILGSTLAGGRGLLGPHLVCTDAGGGISATGALYGATEFTVATFAATSAYTGGSGGWRHLWGQEQASTGDMRVVLKNGVIAFQVGSDGAFTNLDASLPCLNRPVLITARLAKGGIRSIWYGPLKVAERTDASCVFPSGSGDTLGLGTSARNSNRNWVGTIGPSYVWNRALTDQEIRELAADPLAPVRPGAPQRFLTSPGTLNKSSSALLPAQSQAAGATTDSLALTISYGCSILAKVTNGATGPGVGCDVIQQVRESGGTWKEYSRATAGTANNGVYLFRFDLGVGGNGGDWYETRLEFTGNVLQAVTIEANAEATTIL
jgi:hypothetical protein